MSCVEGGAQSLMLDQVTCRLLPHASQNLSASTVRLSDKQRRDTVTEKETFRRPCGGKTLTGWDEGEERERIWKEFRNTLVEELYKD